MVRPVSRARCGDCHQPVERAADVQEADVADRGEAEQVVGPAEEGAAVDVDRLDEPAAELGPPGNPRSGSDQAAWNRASRTCFAIPQPSVPTGVVGRTAGPGPPGRG